MSDTEQNTPEHQAWSVAPDRAGVRLDRFLSELAPERSRVLCQRVIRDGTATLNGRQAKPSQRLSAGDRVCVTWPPERRFDLAPEEIPLDIVYEDRHCLVLNKPPGMVVHPAKGNWTGTVVQALLGHDQAAFEALDTGDMRPGIVHRLDRDTSGLLVVARTESAQRVLARAFAERTVVKEYLALVWGHPDPVSAEVRTLIARHPVKRKQMAVVESGGRTAVSRYRVQAVGRASALLRVRIETGRTHQIRVHCAHIGHPVIGDAVYGGRRARGVVAPRQMLHAWRLCFPHPESGQALELTAPLPEDFRQVLTAEGIPLPESC
jgi:23S rRNA pseudouridine1911/1915/1917 synthase